MGDFASRRAAEGGVASRAPNHYDVVRATWRQRFLEMDCAALAEKFDLRYDEDALYVTYFSHPCAVSRRDGRVTCIDRPEVEVGFDQEINLLNMFHYAVDRPVPAGRLVPFREIRRAAPFESAYVRTILRPFAERFTGRVAPLRDAFVRLGAQTMEQGDAGGALEIVPGLRMAVLFWDGDDEFEAQANMLFDANINDFMHEENVVTTAADAARFLEEAAGLTR